MVVVFIAPNLSLLTQIHNDQGDDTAVVVFAAPRFFLVTRIHDNDDDSTRIIILRSMFLRHQAFFLVYHECTTFGME